MLTSRVAHSGGLSILPDDAKGETRMELSNKTRKEVEGLIASACNILEWASKDLPQKSELKKEIDRIWGELDSICVEDFDS
jgi:hypothetical protein